MTLLLLLACGSAPEPAPAGEEVVVVLIDTLRADHVEGFGAPEGASPFLRRLGDEGVRCTSAWSTSSWTAPSTASLFTGRYPNQTGVMTGMMAMRKLGEAFELNRLPSQLDTLPERFEAAGFQTVGLASNPNIGSELGFSEGFQHFVYEPGASIEELARELKAVPRDGRRRFTYLHLNDVHAPYEPGRRWREGGKPQELYAAELRYLDHHLGRLYEEMGWQDDLVLVLADHGEEFYEHGERGHDALSLHREVTQVPMIWRAPGLQPGTLEDNVSLVDVLPTLVELAQLEPDAGVSGLSLVAALRGEKLPERAIYHHRRRRKPDQPVRDAWGLTDAHYRYLQTPAGAELFALTEGAELRDLSASQPEQAQARALLLEAFQGSTEQLSGEAVELTQSEAEAEMLRVLGYVE